MTDNALVLERLYKRYSNGFEAVKHIDLSVKQGDFFALLGANGAGKSTTISMITSLAHKTSGKIYVYGHDVDINFSLAKQHIGLVPQEFNFNVFEKCIDVVKHQAGYYNIGRKEAGERAAYYLDKLGLYDKRFEQTRNLSGGMKRRLMIARAIAHEPKLLILDEPTAGVDLEIRRSMWAFLQELNANGTTIILTTHYLEEAESLCRNIAIINHGQIIHTGTMKGLLSELDEETFILDIAPHKLDSVALEGIEIIQIDATTLQVSVPKSQGLNKLFALLTEQGIVVLSLRNKVNRLEELFLRLVAE